MFRTPRLEDWGSAIRTYHQEVTRFEKYGSATFEISDSDVDKESGESLYTNSGCAPKFKISFSGSKMNKLRDVFKFLGFSGKLNK